MNLEHAVRPTQSVLFSNILLILFTISNAISLFFLIFYSAMPSTHGNANKCWCCCCWFCCRKRQKSQPRPQANQAQYESACGCVIIKIAVNIKDLYSRSQLISLLIIKPTGYRTRVPLMCSHVPHVQGSHSLSYVMIRGTSHGPPLNTCARWG